MLSRSINALGSYPLTLLRAFSLSGRTLFSPYKNEDEHKDARTWLARFNVNTIPKNTFEVSFSRASGPGGQNVNK